MMCIRSICLSGQTICSPPEALTVGYPMESKGSMLPNYISSDLSQAEQSKLNAFWFQQVHMTFDLGNVVSLELIGRDSDGASSIYD